MQSETNRLGRPLRILVAEDNGETAQALAQLLGSKGYNVHLAADGPAALEAIELHHPDVVLLDIGLPTMDGYEIARKLQEKKLPRRPLLIAITGYGERAERLRAYEAGIDMHLTKPVPPEELLYFLEKVQATMTPSRGERGDRQS